MGYAISFSCRSTKAARMMLAFLQEHASFEARTTGPYDASTLPYARVKVGIGYYKPRPLQTAILRWAALRVGKRKFFKKIGASAPWLNDDGMQSIPVLLAKDWPEPDEFVAQFLVDEHGFQPVPRDWEDDDLLRFWLEEAAKKEDAAILPFLLRLSELWAARPGKAG